MSIQATMKTILFALLFVTYAPFTCLAWGGYDYSNSTFVEIEHGNRVKSGSDIEFFDYDDSAYHDATVDSVTRYGDTVDIEVEDSNTGQNRTLEMEDQ